MHKLSQAPDHLLGNPIMLMDVRDFLQQNGLKKRCQNAFFSAHIHYVGELYSLYEITLNSNKVTINLPQVGPNSWQKIIRTLDDLQIPYQHLQQLDPIFGNANSKESKKNYLSEIFGLSSRAINPTTPGPKPLTNHPPQTKAQRAPAIA